MWGDIDGLAQERRKSSALAMELPLSCINPLIYMLEYSYNIIFIVKSTLVANGVIHIGLNSIHTSLAFFVLKLNIEFYICNI